MSDQAFEASFDSCRHHAQRAGVLDRISLHRKPLEDMDPQRFAVRRAGRTCHPYSDGRDEATSSAASSLAASALQDGRWLCCCRRMSARPHGAPRTCSASCTTRASGDPVGREVVLERI